jgi:sugar/nucleoside kinase (ribokinase family)
MSVDVLCVGHAAYDLSVFVEQFPDENSKCETQELLESGGGPAANAAYLLSLWGVRCACAALVGNDIYGQRIREDFQSVGTDVTLLELRAGHVTPVSVIIINKNNGSRTIVNRKISAPPLRLDATALGAMSPTVLLFDGHELQASREALETFPEATSILDAGSWRDGTSKLAGEVDYLVASERFARQAADLSDLKSDASRRECLRQLRDRFATTVVVTLGECGLIADDGNGFRYLPAFPARTVDTTAAGDIFHGAFAYALIQKESIWESLRFAAMTASLSVRLAGGRSSIPPVAQVKEELAHVQ